jgi:hypothetical protein
LCDRPSWTTFFSAKCRLFHAAKPPFPRAYTTFFTLQATFYSRDSVGGRDGMRFSGSQNRLLIDQTETEMDDRQKNAW